MVKMQEQSYLPPGLNSSTTSRKESADARLMRELNRSIVLNLIRQEGTISRAEIAQRTTLSRSAVSKIIDRLVDEGIVQDIGMGESHGGRRPVILSFNPAAGQVIGLEIGANHLLSIVTDLHGNILNALEQPFCLNAGPQKGLQLILQHLRELIVQTPHQPVNLLGIGVGVPGPLDYNTGRPVVPSIMQSWQLFPLRENLSQEFKTLVQLENDANLGVLAEKWRGIGLEQQHLVYVKLGTSIGCGLMLDGKIYRGQRGSAGEIGHITITRDGPPCRCGSYGCLESLAADPAIVNRVDLAIQAGRKSSLHSSVLAQKLTLPDIVQAAENGDQLACEVLDDAGRYIGIALANLINLCNPGVLIVGGKVASLSELVLNSLKETVRTRSIAASYEAVNIVTSQLGAQAVAIGAATLVLQELFKAPSISNVVYV